MIFLFRSSNNHFGDVGHAKKIISHFSKIVNKKNKATIKFQFRDLESFI